MDVVSDDEDLMDQVCRRELASRVLGVVDRCLTDQERLVIELRYGLRGNQPLRQREVAQITGISRSYVSHHAYCKRYYGK
jgi:RNA polymerase sporulation-specific sigma factor